MTFVYIYIAVMASIGAALLIIDARKYFGKKPDDR